MHIENLLAAPDIGQGNVHLAVEAARTQQCGVQNVGAVGGSHHDDAHVGLEAVHLDQHLVERLLALVIAAAQACAALAAYCVDFVNKNDAGGILLGVVEHVAHPRSAYTHEHFHKIRT